MGMVKDTNCHDIFIDTIAKTIFLESILPINDVNNHHTFIDTITKAIISEQKIQRVDIK